jgi:hypothetical protein
VEAAQVLDAPDGHADERAPAPAAAPVETVQAPPSHELVAVVATAAGGSPIESQPSQPEASEPPPDWEPVAVPLEAEASGPDYEPGATGTAEAEPAMEPTGEPPEPETERVETPLKLEVPPEPAPWQGDWAPVANEDETPVEGRAAAHYD